MKFTPILTKKSTLSDYDHIYAVLGVNSQTTNQDDFEVLILDNQNTQQGKVLSVLNTSTINKIKDAIDLGVVAKDEYIYFRYNKTGRKPIAEVVIFSDGSFKAISSSKSHLINTLQHEAFAFTTEIPSDGLKDGESYPIDCYILDKSGKPVVTTIVSTLGKRVIAAITDNKKPNEPFFFKLVKGVVIKVNVSE